MNRKTAMHSELILLAPFDPDSFSQMPIEGANSTERILVDVGDYAASLDDYKFRPTQGKQDPSKWYMFFDVLWNIDDQNQREKTGRDKVIVRQSLSLDMLWNGSEVTGLDMAKGKNVDFGKLRDAVGLNNPNQPFKFAELKGRTALVHVEQRDNQYEDVTRVTKL